MTPKDTKYYDLLHLSPNASDLEIKKAYRKQAFLNHPDKNPGDKTAHARFQKIGEAYSILSDPHRRRQYDESGSEDIAADHGLDEAMTMFARMFGGESFESWIGEISFMRDIVELIKILTEDDDEHNDTHGRNLTFGEESPPIESPEDVRNRRRKEKTEKFKMERRKRHQKRVKTVVEKLEQRLDGKDIVFEETITNEREYLKLECFGLHILHAIGEVFSEKAALFGPDKESAYVSKWCKYAFTYLGSQCSSVTDTCGVVWSIMETQKALGKLNEARTKARNGGDFAGKASDDSSTPELDRLASGKILMTCWKLTRVDLVKILRDACDHFLYDDNIMIDKPRQEERVSALKTIGKIFKEARRDPEDDIVDGVFEALVAEACPSSRVSENYMSKTKYWNS